MQESIVSDLVVEENLLISLYWEILSVFPEEFYEILVLFYLKVEIYFPDLL